jgi:hypothetical protein
LIGQKPSAPNPPPAAVSYSQVLEDDSADTVALSSSSSSSSDSGREGPAHRSQLFKRPPRFQKQRPRDLLSYDEDLDEDDAERSGDVSLPFAQARRVNPTQGGVLPGKTPQTDYFGAQRPLQSTSSKQKQAAKSEGLDVSSSLASSASDAPKPPGPLSPRHRAELAKLSPRGPGAKFKKEGSEGVPSMGSSFSDIDGE